MRLFPVCLVLYAAALSAHQAMAQTNKCLDDNGRITYSDRLCASAARPSQAPKTAQINKVSGGRLTEKGVAALVKYAADLANASDYRGQCALAAADLGFTLTEQATGSPPAVVKGGKTDICALQRSVAQANESTRRKSVVKPGKLAITLNAASTQATVVYESETTVSSKGQVVSQQRCAHDDVIGVYEDRMLYTRLTSTCKAL